MNRASWRERSRRREAEFKLFSMSPSPAPRDAGRPDRFPINPPLPEYRANLTPLVTDLLLEPQRNFGMIMR